MKSVSHHFVNLETTGPKFKLECQNCGWLTFRHYGMNHNGFGTCNKCGAEMVKYVSKQLLAKQERIKEELRGCGNAK